MNKNTPAGKNTTGSLKEIRLQLMMAPQTNRKLQMIQAYLGGTDGRSKKFKELPKITVIEHLLDTYFKENEEDILKQLLGV